MDIREIEDKRIAVLLSGGVDSSVVVYEFARLGLHPDCFYIKIGPEEEEEWDCSSEEDLEMATAVAHKYGCRLEVVDCHKEYWDQVTKYTMDKVRAGFTPNPDVMCNRLIKFGAFDEKRGHDYDLIATGHYAQTEICPNPSEGGEHGSSPSGRLGEVKWLCTSPDPVKDQTDFLAQIHDWQLRKALFPIGDLLKPEVRRLAKEADLPSADKKDSQGICFVGKVDLPTFLQQQLKSVEGDVVEVFDAYYADSAKYLRDKELLARGTALSDDELLELSTPLDYADIRFETETYRSGKHHVKKTRDKANPWARRIGRHEGAQFYTIGQRKGLGIGGHANPVFVLATDIARNVIYVGEGENHPGLLRSCLRIAPDEIHWIRPDLAMQPGEERRYRVRIRYRQPLQDATLLMRENGLFILFDQPQRSITPGQFAVWYTPDGEMPGSGVIDR